MGFMSVPVLVFSLYTRVLSRMSNLIYLLPVTYLTMWLLIGSQPFLGRYGITFQNSYWQV